MGIGVGEPAPEKRYNYIFRVRGWTAERGGPAGALGLRSCPDPSVQLATSSAYRLYVRSPLPHTEVEGEVLGVTVAHAVNSWKLTTVVTGRGAGRR
jgi:hypothetical protein